MSVTAMGRTGFRIALGEQVERPGRRSATVTEHRWERFPLLRLALVEAAHEGRCLTYGEASRAADGIAPPQGMGEVLDLLALDCSRRGEPNLAALVVDSATREVGDGYGSGAAEERQRCFSWWGHRQV